MDYTFFEAEILKWYKKNGRASLPWRKKSVTPYEVWVSEIMLQQTQVSRVIEYYTRFLQKFPTVFDLAASDWEEFYPYYDGLGYYNRGRNMLQCAKKVVTEYKGAFPQKKEELMLLPGIGEYTASAVLSFGYNKDELAVDTNVKKVLGRVIGGSKEFFLKEKKLEEIKNDLKANKKNLNAALMDFSNRVCIKAPRCGECPLQKICEYFETDGQREKIVSKKQNIFPMKDASVYLFLHKNHKEYYSENKKKYKPFFLSEKYNTRNGLKTYFQKKYNLTLAVRPPFKKTFIGKKPVLFVHAQVLLGNNRFFHFSKEKAKDFEDMVKEKEI